MSILRNELETINSTDSCNTLTKCPFYPLRCKYCRTDRVMIKVRSAVKREITNLKLECLVPDSL